ncbi:MAG: hypothetical protein WCC10_10195 [Tumebacillaceae bacterium]
MMAAFWDGCLRAEGPGIEEQMLESLKQRSQQLLRHGPMGMLASLSPEVWLFRGNRRPSSAAHPRRSWRSMNRTRCSGPSYFVWPHLFVRLDKPVLLNYSIQPILQEARRPTPPLTRS